MGHNVGKAAENAVKNSQKKVGVVLTPQQLIDELRKNLASVPVGYVPTHQIVALLTGFDAANARIIELLGVNGNILLELGVLVEQKRIATDTIFGLTQTVQRLQAAIDQFRAVYEAENSHQTITVEKVSPTVLAPALSAAVSPEIDRFHDDGGLVHPDAQ